MIIFQIKGFHKVRICSLQVVLSRFLLVIGRLRSFLARSNLFQVVSGRFLLVAGRFRLFLPRCRSFQIVSHCFRLFQVVSCFSKYAKLLQNDAKFKQTITPGSKIT